MESSSSGTLEVNGITLTQGSGGQLQANGGAVLLDNGAVITGGSFNSSNGGLFTVGSGGATLTNVTNNATVNLLGTNTLNVTGTLADNGTIVVNSNQNGATGSTVMVFDGATVSGSGSIILNYVNGNATVSGTLTQGASHSMSGYGEITAALTNNGTVNADINNQTLTLLTNNMTNNGVMKAASGGTLEVSGITLTQGTGGQLQANGGTVQFDSGTVINGGKFTSSNGGSFNVASGGATFENITNNTTVDLLGENVSNTLNITGTLVDNGSIVVNSNHNGNSGLTVLNSINATVSGTGDIVLDYVASNATLSGTATQQAGHTISGYGQITAALTNNGAVVANAGGQTLAVNGATNNNGLMQATDDGYLQFGGGALNNLSGNVLTGGTYEADANSTLSLPGTVATNAASLILNGSNAAMSGITSLASNQGSLSVLNGAALTTGGALQNSGTLALGGELAISGSLSLASTSRLLFQIGGRQQGGTYGFLDVSGSAALNGILELSFANGFDSQVLISDTFAVLTSAFPLSGNFSNVTNGERLFADDSVFSFVVNFGPGSPYGADEIVLSDAIPEPSIWALLAAAPAIFWMRRPRRRWGNH